MRNIFRFVLLLQVFAGVPAFAETAQEQIRAAAGVWEMSNSDRDKICAITLKPDPAPGAGARLEFDKACVTVFPMMRDVVAWNLANEVLTLLDGRNRAVMQFSEVENGMYEGERPGEGLYFMQSAAAAGPAPRTADQMAGDWAVVRGENKTICQITLTTDPNTGGEGYALRVRPPCDSVVTRFNPALWKMAQGELVLVGRGDATWRFEEDDPNTWRRVPDNANSLLLVRK